MRLDAARLKGCFGSCFRQKLLPEVQGVPPPRASEEPASRRVFSFLAFTLPPHGSRIQPLDPENIEKSALGSFRGPIIQFQPVVYPCLGTKRGSAEERPSDERNEPVPLKLTPPAGANPVKGWRGPQAEGRGLGPLHGTPTSNLGMGRRPEWALTLHTPFPSARRASNPRGYNHGGLL